MTRRRSRKKILRRCFLIFIALLFMAEAWLWDITGAAVRWLVAILPLEALKHRLHRAIDSLSPIQTVAVFTIPALVLLPIKFAALWCLAHGFFLGGVGLIILAKLAGLGVSSFLFTLCKPKLLQLRWVSWLYEQCIHLRAHAAMVLKPYLTFVRRYRTNLARRFPQSKLFEKMRGRVHNARKAKAAP